MRKALRLYPKNGIVRFSRLIACVEKRRLRKKFFSTTRVRARRRLRRFSAEHVNLVSPPLVARSVRRNANKLDCASRPLQPALAARFPPSVPPSHKVTHDGYPGCRDVRQGDAGAHSPARAEPGHALSGIVLSRVAFPRNAVQKALRSGPTSAWRAREPAHAAPDGPARLADAPRASRGRVSPSSVARPPRRGFRWELWIMPRRVPSHDARRTGFPEFPKLTETSPLPESPSAVARLLRPPRAARWLRGARRARAPCRPRGVARRAR